MNKLHVIKTMYTFIFIRVVYFNCLYTVWTGVYIDIHMCKSNASLHSLTLQQEVLMQTRQDLNPAQPHSPRPIPPSFSHPWSLNSKNLLFLNILQRLYRI